MSTTNIPSANDVNLPGGGQYQYWRIGSGQIETGSEKKGTEKTVPKMVGKLVRVGIHEAEFDGKKRMNLEAELETADFGKVNLSVDLLDMDGTYKPGVKAVTFAEGLTRLPDNTENIIAITAAHGRKANKFGKYPTYVNLYLMEEGEFRELRGSGGNTGKGLTEQFADARAILEKMSFWGERSAAQSIEDGTHLAELERECREHGWTLPSEKPEGWLTLMAAMFEEDAPRATLTDWSDDDWGQVRNLFANDLKWVKPGRFDELVTNYDPFADQPKPATRKPKV